MVNLTTRCPQRETKNNPPYGTDRTISRVAETDERFIKKSTVETNFADALSCNTFKRQGWNYGILLIP